MSPKPPITLDRSIGIAQLGELARQRLDPGAYDYCAGGAGDELTLRENEAAFTRRRLVQHVLRDVDVIDTKTTVLGTKINAPIMVGPVSLQKMVDPEGEVAAARAAHEFGTVFALSMNSSCSLEEVSAAIPESPRWAQIYVLRAWEVTESVTRRAEEAGYEAVVLTVDVPRVGRRERDIRNKFSRLDAGNPDILRDPAFLQVLSRHATQDDAYDAVFPNPTATWTDVARVRELTKLPLVIKGILDPEDARQAIAAGAQAIVVSNHGGRQFERAPATIDVLPDIVEAVGDEAEVYLDSGVRRGTDVLTALALGARAVLIGRAALWGLACAGEAGVLHALNTLYEELTYAMTMVGAASVGEIDNSIVRHAEDVVIIGS